MARKSPIAPQDITIFDVAREANVSYSTVSRVINNKGVRADKRERVLRAMSELGYVANLQARSLAGGKSNIIGLLVHSLTVEYFGEIARGVDEELAALQYDLMLYTTHRRKGRESAYVTRLTRNLVDGLLLVLPQNAETYLETLRHRRFPHVLVDHQGVDFDVPSVGATNWQGGYDGTHYLIELGHRRIGFITGDMTMGCARDRLAGYQQALTDAGIPVNPTLICEGDFLQPQAFICANVLLDLEQPPTAIFASNDVSAFGAMEAIRTRGLHIPGDVSILGFDDTPQSAQVHPALTTIRQPLAEMGRTATQLLFTYINEPDAPIKRIELPTKLVVRQSCQAPTVSSLA
ncbi:MAG TPA: LacI family DNA-binding transcriptional regulator [Ktedonobacterales bacterium]|jgi:LacI family transcriptional regulator